VSEGESERGNVCVSMEGCVVGCWGALALQFRAHRLRVLRRTHYLRARVCGVGMCVWQHHTGGRGGGTMAESCSLHATIRQGKVVFKLGQIHLRRLYISLGVNHIITVEQHLTAHYYYYYYYYYQYYYYYYYESWGTNTRGKTQRELQRLRVPSYYDHTNATTHTHTHTCACVHTKGSPPPEITMHRLEAARGVRQGRLIIVTLGSTHTVIPHPTLVFIGHKRTYACKVAQYLYTFKGSSRGNRSARR